MENRIDDQMGDRKDGAVGNPDSNRSLHQVRSGAWWRAVAEHYGPSAAKVTSTLAFAFAIGIGLGVVLASGLDDSADYDLAQAHASDGSTKREADARKAVPEPPYAIEVSVRENTQPAAAQLGDIFADIASETAPTNPVKGAADEPAVPEPFDEDLSRESDAPVPTDTAASVTPPDEEPAASPVAAGAADASLETKRPVSGTPDRKTVAALAAPPTPKATEKPAETTVMARSSVEDAAEKPPAPALPVVEDGDAVRNTDETVNVADDASFGGESDGADRLTGPQLASLPGPRDATWLRHALGTPREPGKAMVAIVIDDLGIDQKRTRRAIDMPAPMTMSFIPYGYNLSRLTKTARAGGHEILLHLPMEPLRRSVDPGPHAMLTTLSAEELRKRLVWNLARLEGYVGVNNHMGSRFTAWRPGMRLVMREIRERGLLFLDSWTNKRSYGAELARENGVPSAVRDVFIDHDIDAASIGKRLRQLESIARRRGYAIGIGHPYDLTIKLLPAWMASAKDRGIQFVPISTIVQRRMTAG